MTALFEWILGVQTDRLPLFVVGRIVGFLRENFGSLLFFRLFFFLSSLLASSLCLMLFFLSLRSLIEGSGESGFVSECFLALSLFFLLPLSLIIQMSEKSIERECSF